MTPLPNGKFRITNSEIVAGITVLATPMLVLGTYVKLMEANAKRAGWER